MRSEMGIESGAVHPEASDRPYRMSATTRKGDLVFFDREYTIDSLPPELDGGALVSAANAFKRDNSPGFMSFSLAERADVNVLLDSAYSVRPPYFASGVWKNLPIKARTSAGTMNVARATFNPGTVVLPGPASGGATGNRTAYAVLLKKNIDNCVVQDLNPATMTVACGGMDTGTILYADTTWIIKALSSRLRSMTLVRTLQAGYANANDVAVGFRLMQSGWLYCAVDSVHTWNTLPAFMRQIDDSSGGWTYSGYTLRNSNNGSYNLYRKFFKAGSAVFSGARSGGELNNRYNYVFLFDPMPPIPPNDTIISPFAIGDKPFTDLPEITVTRLPGELTNKAVKPLLSQPGACTDVVLPRIGSPMRVYLALSPSFRTEGSFLELNGWTHTELTISFNKYLPDYMVWTKDFPDTNVTLPGVQCNGYDPNLFNYVVFMERLDYPVEGYHAENLAVRGFGNDRKAQSESFKVKNLDVSYAYSFDMHSTSWRMRVNATGGRLEAQDTLRVLSAFIDTVISAAAIRTHSQAATPSPAAIIVADSFNLSDLVPVYVNADSVTVKALDLSTGGAVRVAFTNKSAKAVTQEFSVVLFEDRDGDYQYNSSVDKFLGRGLVKGIGAHEYKVFEIPLTDKLSFPKNTIFGFVDADRWVDEINERNNIASSGTTCEHYVKPTFVADTSDAIPTGLSGFVPQTAIKLLYCRLKDTNGDSLIDNLDELYVVYIDNYYLHAVNTQGIELFKPLRINGLAPMELLVADLNNDNKPEIVVGNVVYDVKGTMLWDASNKVVASANNWKWDINRDGDADSVAIVDSCVTVWSGRDTSLLFVSPFTQWPGRQSAATVGVLANAVEGGRNCYDLNVSYPRMTLQGADTASLTIRVGNIGAATIRRGVDVVMYADNEADSLKAQRPQGVRIAALSTSKDLRSGDYEDVAAQAILPHGTKRIWFMVNEKRRVLERNEMDNWMKMEIR